MKTIFVCFLLIIFAGTAFSQSPEARFLEVNGTVETKESETGNSDPSDWKKAVPGDIIGNNTVISTGFRSRAVISLGSSRLQVLPLTRLTLEELVRRGNTETAILYLRTGRVRAAVTPPPEQRVDFTVRSPVITASVRGTSFEFNGTYLRADNGRILLTASSGQKVYVVGDQQSYVDENNQNRIVPPFEAEIAMLRPVLPELNNTGSSAEPPEIGIAPGLGTTIDIGWP
jgi:hypothetical protein